MKIIFVIKYITYYRFFSSLIQEGINQGYNVECWHDYSCSKKGMKHYLFPDLDITPKLYSTGNRPIYKIFHGDQELFSLLDKDSSINVVVSLHRLVSHNIKRSLFPSRLLWVTILHGSDSFFELGRLSSLNPYHYNNEVFYIYSKKWEELGNRFLEQFYPEKKWLLEKNSVRIETIGNPEFDQVEGIFHSAVKKKYNIPEQKKILLYLPFPYYKDRSKSAWEIAFCGYYINTLKARDGSYYHDRVNGFFKKNVIKLWHLLSILSDSIARKFFFRKVNEISVFREIRKYCDRNDLYLVVKPRLKFPIPEIIKSEADLVIWDDESQQVPPVLKELLSISRLCVSYNSYSVLSAIFSGVYHLNVTVPDAFFPNKASKYWFSYENQSIFNYPECGDCWSSEEVINNLENTPIEKFSLVKEKRKAYLERYNLISDTGSAKLFYKSITSKLMIDD